MAPPPPATNQDAAKRSRPDPEEGARHRRRAWPNPLEHRKKPAVGVGEPFTPGFPWVKKTTRCQRGSPLWNAYQTQRQAMSLGIIQRGLEGRARQPIQGGSDGDADCSPQLDG